MINHSIMTLTHLDPLTGAYDRSTLGQQLTHWVELSEAGGTEFSVVIIDLDYFKSINDAFGHRRGDQALVEVTDRIKANIRRQDQLYRYGGDEFVLLLPDSSPVQAVKVVERIRDALANVPLDGTPPVKISASYGLASFPRDAHTPESLFGVMDRRLYYGKAMGRGRIIASEVELASEPRLLPPERLVERDMEYQQAQLFLEGLSGGGSLFHVTGRPGTGRSRFLTECNRLARLQGYAVWSLKGSPALRFHKGGALANFTRLAGLADTRSAPTGLLEALHDWVKDQGLAGLLLSIDDVDGVDSFSLEVIGSLLERSTDPHFSLGLIYSGSTFQDAPACFEHVRRRKHVELKNITPAGLRVWLRYSLNWEPPESFTTWFYQQTGGLPSAVMSGLGWLYDQGLLRPADGLANAGGWSISRMPDTLEGSRADPTGPGTNLPVISTDLYGREEELWQIKALLNKRAPVTLCGPDGMGKSRLALQAATETRDAYADGVFWLALHDHPAREDLLFLLARLMDHTIRSQEEKEEEIISLYRDKRILLVLDELAPGSPSALFVSRMAQDLPDLQLLITSQRPLNFPGERVLPLSGLPAPEDPQEMEWYPATQLFLASARSSLLNFQPAPEDRPAILDICRLVEGVPLAIELAGVWVSSFSCLEIARRIEHNIQFLGQPAPGLAGESNPNRITAVMDSFWRLFSHHEQIVLASLSVFSHSFTAEAALQVADVSPFFLDALIAKKYLHVVGSQRCAMHFLLASYAAAQMHADPMIENEARQRHARYFLEILARKNGPQADRDASDECILNDMDNFRRAWEHTVHAGDYSLLRRSLDELCALFFNMGHFNEGIRLLSLALHHLPVQPVSSDAVLLRAGLLTKLGEFYFHIGHYSQGQPVLEEAVDILKTLAMHDELAEVLRLLANLVGAMGDYDRAICLLEEGLAMTSPVTAPNLYFNLLNRAGVMAYFKKDFAEANAHFERALHVARQINDTTKVAVILNNQGSVALDMRDLERARTLLVESARLCQVPGRVTLQASVIDTLARVEAGLNDLPAACGHFIQSLRLVQTSDAIPLAMEILMGIAEMWRQERKDAQAAELAYYIKIYSSIPDDVSQRVTNLIALLADQPAATRWQGRPWKWVIQDVIDMLGPGK